jgi:hypothetical protein
MAVAYPFIDVTIDTSALAPVAERAPGVIAVVGESDAGSAAANTPVVVASADDVDAAFGNGTRLATSLKLALLQDPRPSKVYGVKSAGAPPAAADYTAALAGLEAADDVTFVSLANEPVNLGAANTNAATSLLQPLKTHVENMLAAGQKRIAVAMVNPAARSANDVATITNRTSALKSDRSRMVMIAARGGVMPGTNDLADVATASMAAVAGLPPQVSMVLKPVRGFQMPTATQFGPTEITDLSAANIIPIIDPALIVGESLHFAEGQAFTTDAKLLYVDSVRVLDDIDFRLKAGLIGAIGDARITKAGLSAVKTRTEGILGPLQRNAVIDGFDVRIPVLDVLFMPEAARSPDEVRMVNTARENRRVEMIVSITYGPAVHKLLVTLAPKF